MHTTHIFPARPSRNRLWSGAALLAGMLFSCNAGATPVFVNELHYDNSGSDTGEGVEIAGPAGTALAGWSLVFYNGGTGSSYATVALSGTIPDQQNGFGTLFFTHSSIQNGAPDGLALVDASDAVQQFLSYEGNFTASGGPADGLASSDIGVVEDSSTGVGESLQLQGSGQVYEDFTWGGPLASTFGDINTNQSFVRLGGSDPVPSAGGDPAVPSVPEPGAIALFGLGLGVLVLGRRKCAA